MEFSGNTEIEKLENAIKYYSEKYYEGEPEISDQMFDGLVDKLRLLSPESYVLTTGWGFEVKGDKVKHKYSHIGSLDKTKTFEDIPAMYKNKMVYISPKLDGLSAVLYYKQGKLVRAVTRGNGEYGKDITRKMKIVEGYEIPDSTFTGAVRGELIIHSNNWKLLQSKYDNLIAPRNFAAGIINRKEVDEDIKYIDLVVYKVVGQESKPVLFGREDIIRWLNINFKHCIPLYYYPSLDKQSWETYSEMTFEQFLQIGYGLDGLVLTIPEVQFNSVTQGYVYQEVAFKFPAETATTVIKDIEWELSRTNRLIPVAVVEPVELSGAIVQRATCNNAKWVQDMELGREAEIEITRSNEVIPQILSVLQPSEEPLPTKCPICGQDLVWEGVDLKCINDTCPNIKLSDLQQWCESVGETDGLQWTLMKQYLDLYGVKDIDDLYNKKDFIWNDLNTKKLSITELKVKDFFEALYFKPVLVEKALIGLNIPRLGDKTSKLLSGRQDIISALLHQAVMPQIVDNLGWIEDSLLELVKDATTETMMANLSKFKILRYCYSDDYRNCRLVFTEKKTDEIKFIAVTGALNTMKRKDFENYIAKYGYELTSNLKKCSYLVNNDINSTSSKNKQAKQYGIPIVTEEEFLKSLS